jgi:hypothetical protein
MFKLVVATVIVALATPAVAQIQPDVQFALHNGSVMAVLSDGAGGVRIEYAEPKPSLLQIGVRQGTLLFDGRVARRCTIRPSSCLQPGLRPLTL